MSDELSSILVFLVVFGATLFGVFLAIAFQLNDILATLQRIAKALEKDHKP